MFRHIILSVYLPLSSSGALYEALHQVRGTMIRSGGGLMLTCKALAALFCLGIIVSLVGKIAQETAGGHGEVELKELAKPFLMMALLCAYPQVIAMADWAFGSAGKETAQALSNIVKVDKATFKSGWNAIMDKADRRAWRDDGYEKQVENKSWVTYEDKVAPTGDTYQSPVHHYQSHTSYIPMQGQTQNTGNLGQSAAGDSPGSLSLMGQDVTEEALHLESWWDRTLTKIKRKLRTWYYAFFIAEATYTVGLGAILFKICRAVVLTYAEIMLTIMAMFGCIAFTFGILPPWKNAIKDFIGKYITYSLWGPITAIISAGVFAAVSGMAKSSELLNGGTMNFIIDIITTMILFALEIAGCAMIFQAGSVASDAVSLADASGLGGATGSGAAMAAAGGAAAKQAAKTVASKGVGAAKGAVKGVTGAVGMAAGAAAAKKKGGDWKAVVEGAAAGKAFGQGRLMDGAAAVANSKRRQKTEGIKSEISSLKSSNDALAGKLHSLKSKMSDITSNDGKGYTRNKLLKEMKSLASQISV